MIDQEISGGDQTRHVEDDTPEDDNCVDEKGGELNASKDTGGYSEM